MTGSAAGQPAGPTAPAGHDELAPGWDESPDGAVPRPVDELGDAELTALLRTRSTAPGRAHCAPDEVEVFLAGHDVALGHRFTRIVVRNVSDSVCLVEGYPGIGARGTWGTTFVPEVGRLPASVPDERPVQIAPGQVAASQLEWSGELAGAESERAETLVVQLAVGQVPVPVAARLVGEPADVETLDIGALSTLRLGPFAPLSEAEARDLPGSRLEPALPEK